MKKIIFKIFMAALLASPVALFAWTAQDENLEEGKTVFMNRCKMCHGEDGTGNPAMARILKVEFPAMHSEYVQKKPDDEIKEIITKGKGKMAAVRGLTEDQISNVIAYVRSLSEKKNENKE